MTGPGTAAGTASHVVSVCRGVRAVAAAFACLAAGACAQSGPGALDLAAPIDSAQPAAKDTRTDLAKATGATGKDFAKEPRNPEKAVAYARNLKAMGEKRQALAVLQQAASFNAGHRGLNSEYGRLALELDQVSVAQRLLEAADDPANPDWRVISARGTVLAKQGSYREAIPLYERALALAPDQASILNNLALAHAMEGQAGQAEALLKRAASSGSKDARVNQNLALVLGLQGKYDEARVVAARDLPADNAAANVDYVRRIVMLEPRPMAQSQQPPPAHAATAPAARPSLRGPALDDAGGWAPQVAVAPAHP
ncbi:MAG: tetratricopeptide repeat protein [Hyphomonadaceae bacterium]|nr:tetratricopeptide repeat protein [Hyphomonadaceae bacterium]